MLAATGSPAFALVQVPLAQHSLVSAPTDVISFPDPNLEASIRSAINKPSGPIYRSNVESLTSLTAWGKGIVNLSGIENCINLEGLWVYQNNISDISVLSSLTKLRGVYLCYNQISNISALADLTRLEVLYCSHNPLSDISIAAGLPNLNKMNLSADQISDITPLVWNAGIGSGDTLDISSNNLNTMPLSVDMVNIQTLINRGVSVNIYLRALVLLLLHSTPWRSVCPVVVGW